jgi:methionine salvage enolase-phosphatase E1
MKNQKKEEIYSAVVLTTDVLFAYLIRLIALLDMKEEELPEVQKLVKAIENVKSKTSMHEMNDRMIMNILRDNENLINIIDKFMNL